MIRDDMPTTIRTDADLAEYTEALFALTGKAERSLEDEEAIELLTVLIDRYESERYLMPEAKPVEVLRFLLGQSGLAQRDIASDLGGEFAGVGREAAAKSRAYCSFEPEVWGAACGVLWVKSRSFQSQ